MDQVTKQTAANTEESASAAKELNAQSETLKDIVGRLTTMVGGGAAHAGTRQSHRRPTAATGKSSAPGERTRRGALGSARGCVAPTKILGPRSAGSCGPRREQGSPST
jgi:hypothetical protein